jgi:hypothetical protein
MSATPRRSARLAGIPAAPPAPLKAPRRKYPSLRDLKHKWLKEEVQKLERDCTDILTGAEFRTKWERSLASASHWTQCVSSEALLALPKVREDTKALVSLLKRLLPVAYDKIKCLESQLQHLGPHSWSEELEEDLYLTRLLVIDAHTSLDRWIRLMQDMDNQLPEWANPFHSDEKPTEECASYNPSDADEE